MSDYDYDNAVFRIATAQEAEPEDYTGEDGLLYCGKCRQPKEAYFAEGRTLFGRDRHPKECDCQRKRRETLEAADREQKHREEVERLKTLMNDKYPQQEHRRYCPPPGLRDRGTPGEHRACRFRLLQTGRYRHRRRQNDESAGSGSCRRRNSRPCHIVRQTLIKKCDIFRHKVAKRTVQTAAPCGMIDLRNSGAGCRKRRNLCQDRLPQHLLPPYIRDYPMRTNCKARAIP